MSKRQKPSKELSDEQLETVAGGINGGFTGGVQPLPEQPIDTSYTGNTLPSLTQACATGEHIKKAILF